MFGVCEGTFAWGVQLEETACVGAHGVVCPGASMVDVFRGESTNGDVCPGWLAPRGAFVPGVYATEALSGSSLVSVVVMQNFSEIGQFAAKL